MIVICDYCNNPAQLVTGADLYPHRTDLADKKAYRCVPCGAHVGCHKGTDKPLGRLANAELREAKMRAHAAFDPIWIKRLVERRKTDPTYTKGMARGGRYKALALAMGIPREECHIGMFDVSRCEKAIELIRAGALS